MQVRFMQVRRLARRAIAPVILAATVWPAPAALAQAQQPGVTVVVPDSIDNLDPCRSARNDVGRIVKDNITETLTDIDPKSGAIVPMLATAWTQVSPSTWRFTLRQGVTFQDGAAFDAEAAAKAIARTVNPALDCTDRQKFFGTAKLTTKVVDPHTLDVTTDPVQPILPTLMALLSITSPRTDPDQPDRTPVGTGPYRLASWTPGQQVVLDRFDGYWGAKPAVAEAKFVYRAESAVAAAMVATGEADLAPYIAVQDATDPKTDVGYLNTDTGQVSISTNVAPLNDARVRQALNLLVDRQAFVGTILSKDVQPASQLVLPFIFGYDPGLKPWPYDPDKAKALLDAARADGVPVDKEITLYGRPGFLPNLPDVMQALAQMWQAGGLNVKTQMIEKAQFIKLVTQPHAADRPPSLFLNLHDNSSGDASFSLFFKYSSQGGQSETHDAALDKLILGGGKETGDARRQAFQAAFRMIHDQIVPDVMLFHFVGYARVGPRIEFQPNSLTNNRIPIASIGLRG